MKTIKRVSAIRVHRGGVYPLENKNNMFLLYPLWQTGPCTSMISTFNFIVFIFYHLNSFLNVNFAIQSVSLNLIDDHIDDNECSCAADTRRAMDYDWTTR